MKLKELREDAGYQFRKIEREDADRVLELEATFKEAPWKKAESFFKPQYDTQLLTSGDEIVGYYITKKSEEGDGIILVKMMIDPKYQGKGLGMLMLKQIIKAKKVYLDVRTNNKNAIALYKKAGFKEIETREKYYKNGDDALYMST